ncbi:hypothetical protein [Thermomonospora catenispora]|uniref:hypothetical protein n=1 Tax=Thermomonospora catenispora TaxID=2493090 RepID=UPI001124B3DF|nr:hypothetical protein [Thermomonospora catenispora]TNY34507.1 hypothetical protein EIO00_23375 [Thermomonospora catenispora]
MTSEGSAAPVAATDADLRLAHLERLADALTDRGLQVRLSAPTERPASLHVINPRATALTENILAENGADGWWYWWSWAERIAAVDDLETAADRIARVLAAE